MRGWYYLSVSLFLGEVLVWELGSISLELPCWVRAASLARCICCLTNQKRELGEIDNEKRVLTYIRREFYESRPI